MSSQSKTRAQARLMGSVCASAILAVLPSLGWAQDNSAQVESVVVTASRIVRDGMQAPTPVTVIGREQIQAAAPANIADYVNQLPQLQGSSTPRTGNGGTGGGTAGSNFLNLRNLGNNRTLVLLDRRRVIGSTLTGTVDVNILPQALVSRVDVVTGGASAQWGSDAVAGVVNFVLDTKYTGFKGEIQGGISDEGDSKSGKLELTYGHGFAQDRGHLLLSGVYSQSGGVGYSGQRDWYAGWKLVANPAFVAGNGQPRQIVARDVNLSQAAPGGLISTGPLRGVQFGLDGRPQPYEFGTISGVYSIGGEFNDLGAVASLESPLWQQNLFGRLSFEITDSLTAYAEFLNGHAVAHVSGAPQWRFNNITIQRDNAFLDESIRARMVALNLPTFSMGTTNPAVGVLRPVNDREVTRTVLGLDGKLPADWTWRSYYQHGESVIHNEVREDIITDRYNLATDAVRSPTTGAIVCRSTLTNPTNGCVPLNLFGAQSASKQALAWVTGISILDQTLKQDVFSVDASGDVGATWAGPISLAVGAEHRKESVTAAADALSLVNGFFAGNFKPTLGEYSVTEGFAEVNLPLAKDMAFAQSFEVNGAVRRTHYSTAGAVTTWKLGATWALNDEWRFRATRSRDIRAPNLSDLFQAGTVTTQTVNDPSRNLQTVTITRITQGNTTLDSELGDTLDLGVVYQPGWLPGLNASIDLYDIKIQGAVATLGNQAIADGCFLGDQDLCALITRNSAGAITTIRAIPINFAEERTKGGDVEVSYRTNLSDFGLDGALTVRALGTYIDSHTTTNNNVVDQQAGEVGQPHWRWFGTLAYELGSLQTTLTVRHTPEVKYDMLWVEGVDTNDNTVDSATLLNLSARYRFTTESEDQIEVFGAIDNLLDANPPVVAGGGNLGFIGNGVSAGNYDVIGRSYRIGLRVRY